MSAVTTPALDRAANELAQGGVGLYIDRARRVLAAALGATDLETLTFRHRRMESDMWHCACGVRVHNVADHSNHQAAMIRTALLGADS